MICKLIIRDEVNVKLEGLDLSLRKSLSNKFKYEIPGVRYSPSVRLGRWDGKVAFFSLGGATYINLLPDILKILENNDYDIEIEDQRDYSTSFQFNSVKENSFAHIVWPDKHPQAGAPIMLRDYQTEIINRFLENPQCIQEVATGSGKTIMTAVLSASVQNYGRTIVIVPSKSLVTQTEADYRNLGLDVGVLFGERKEHDKQHTICTWQSLNTLLKNTKSGTSDYTIQEFLENVVCVMVDEAHSAKADALKTLLSTVFSRVPIRWGLTGTIPKEEYAAMSLKCCIGELVGKLSAKELQDAGHLAQCHVNILQLTDYVEYSSYQQELKYLLENKDRIQYISRMIAKIRASGNTLVLVDRVAAGREITNQISDAVFVSGTTKSTNRKEEYDQIAISDNKVIVATYGVAAVGINIPRIFNLVLLEPGKSFVRVIQSIGRGIRKAEDKTHVEIWDITSTCKFSKRHLTKRKSFYNEAQYPFSIEKVEWQ